MNANSGSWLSAHGKLWYDDPWYRLAWIMWPQAIGLLLFVALWLNHPLAPAVAPWARPVAEVPRAQAAQPNVIPQPQQQPQQQLPQQQQPQAFVTPVDLLAPCKGDNYPQVIPSCTAQLVSGKLRGDDVAAAYWYRGWAYHQTEQYQQAMSDYDRAISINPRESDFYNDRGNLWIDLGKNDRALQDLDQAILIKPDYEIPYANRGRALVNLKRPNEALVAFSKAIELKPSYYFAYEKRASLNEDRSNWRAVFDDGSKMIELQPDNRLGYEYRGHAYFEVGQYSAAINDLTRAISIDPSAIYGYRVRGRAYFLSNQYDAAMADYQAALRIDPKDSTTIDYMNELKRRRR
jgi:tetratricopeptide (TPR) repeat protein